MHDDHDHSHDHDGHAHAASASAVRRADPGFSLLRLSALQRLAGAGVIIALLWLAVLWALN
jgi:hypothetical protein